MVAVPATGVAFMVVVQLLIVFPPSPWRLERERQECVQAEGVGDSSWWDEERQECMTVIS